MNCRKLLMVAVTITACYAPAFSQSTINYHISGKIPGATEIYLAKDNYGEVILDSVKNNDGSFSFKGTVPEISMGSLIVKQKGAMFTNYHNLFIEPGNVIVKMYKGGRQISATGSKNNDIMTKTESANQEFFRKVSVMYDTVNFASMRLFELRHAEQVDKDSVKYYESVHARIYKESEPYILKRNKVLKDAFNKYPDSYFTAYYVMASGALSEDEMKVAYERFNDDIKISKIGQEWNKQLTAANQLEDGSDAPAFSAEDMNGKKVSLSDFKGKYVLLDFWATWCGPCRAGNPHLIELYNKYKDKGIEFIGISDDDANVKGWKKAIGDDGIGIWPQVLRNRGKENADISNMYMVTAYPTKILIDREGKIVKQYTGEDGLDEMLQELLGK